MNPKKVQTPKITLVSALLPLLEKTNFNQDVVNKTVKIIGDDSEHLNSNANNVVAQAFFQCKEDILLKRQLQIGHSRVDGIMDHLTEAADQEDLFQEAEVVEILHLEDAVAVSHPEEDVMVVLRLEEISLQGEVVEAIKTTQTEVISILQCSKIHGPNLPIKTIGECEHDALKM